MALIEVENLVKTFQVAKRRPGMLGALRGVVHRKYQEVRALDGVSFSIEPGELVGYVGPNGAGKSTTVKVLSGILVPDSGKCEVMGRVPWEERIEHVRRIAAASRSREVEVRDAASLYLKSIMLSVRAQMQYRTSFVLSSIAQFLVTAVEFFAIWALFERFGSLQGWRIEEVALLYGMANVSFGIAEFVAHGFGEFDQMVKSGDFDRVLLRPRGTAFQIASREVQVRVGRLLQGIAVLLFALWTLDVSLTVFKAALLLIALASGVALFSGLFVLRATLAFFTIEALEIMATVTYGGVETTQYPISIYDKWFRRFFIFVVPLSCMNYFPALAITGRADPLGTPVVFQWLAPLVGFLFLAACLRIWTFGVRHYRSTGS